MQIHKMSPSRVKAIYRDIRPWLRVGRHVADLTQKLTGLTASELETLIRTGRYELLNDGDQENIYLLVYAKPRDEVFVAAAAFNDAAYEDGQPVVVDLLRLDEFESQGGRMYSYLPRRAAAKVLNDVDLRAWEARHLDAGYKRRLPVFTVHHDHGGGKKHVYRFKRPPVCWAWMEEHGQENALGHPGVKEWFKEKLDRLEIDLDGVLSLEITEARRMTLRVRAIDRPCPHCAAPVVEESRGWLTRLISRLGGPQ